MFSRLLLVAALLSVVAGFAPQSVGRLLITQQNALADNIFGMDLFSPKANQNDYGARGKKNIKVGNLTAKSYVPTGLSKADYDKIRKAEFAKKQKNYQEREKKAFKFIDFTDWYAKRGTDLDKGTWLSSVNKGHTMVKTKYDWSGTADAKKFESTSAGSIFGPKKVAPKKK